MSARPAPPHMRVVLFSVIALVALGAPIAPTTHAEEGGEGPFGVALSECKEGEVEVDTFDEQGNAVKDQQDNPVTERVKVWKCHADAESFDGLPLSATLTLPAEPRTVNERRPLPLVVIRHGSGGEKGDYQHADASDIRAWNNDWNDVAFAKRGYAVLTYTARGWFDSCGPEERADPMFAEKCEGPPGQRRAYWVHIYDPRWEVRDAQTLIGQLVDEGWVIPEKIGVYGFSMGGMEAWLLAMLNDHTMHLDGSLHRWRSPAGRPLRVAAVIPEAIYAAPAHGYAPNGRSRDEPVPTVEQLSQPFGIVLGEMGPQCAQAPTAASLAPPQADPTADWASWCRRLAQGNPFQPDPVTDPVLLQFVEEMRFRSALRFDPSRPRVPVFLWQGLTDGFTPGIHGVMVLNRLRNLDHTYPIKASFHDAGHAPAANGEKEYGPLFAAGHAFFNYHLRDQGAPPSYDVSATSPRCAQPTGIDFVDGVLAHDGDPVTLTAPRWRDLSTDVVTFTAPDPPAGAEVTHTTASHIPLPTRIRTDVPDQPSKPVCPMVAAAESTGAPTWTFPSVTEPFVLAGAPELRLSYRVTGTDAQISVRLWDVAPDGLTQKLVSRGVYRHDGTLAPAEVHNVSFQLWPQVWPVEEGHRLRVEITGNDMPYLQQDNIPFTLHISSVELSVPRA